MRDAQGKISPRQLSGDGAALADALMWGKTRWLPESAALTTIVSFGATGWKYHTTTLADTTDYSSPSFNDSGWSSGQGAFGSGTGPTAVNTAWAVDSRIWLRRSIPAGSDFLVYGIVDNYARLYWNGTLFASVNGADNGDAAFGPIPVPARLVTGGTQTLAVRASDDSTVALGDVSLIDISVKTGTTPRISGSLLRGILGAVRVDPTPNEDWNTATLLNSWTNLGSPFSAASYAVENGRVWLRGVVTGGVVSGTLPIFTLPSGYRPEGQCILAATSGTPDGTAARVDVQTNGDVMLRAGATGYVSLDGLSFRQYD